MCQPFLFFLINIDQGMFQPENAALFLKDIILIKVGREPSAVQYVKIYELIPEVMVAVSDTEGGVLVFIISPIMGDGNGE